MKKTEKTALTAALFAAALNFVPSDAKALSDDPVQAAREEMAGVYGPPPQYSETVETAETTTIVTNEFGFDVINSTFKTQPAYGPPITYEPTETVPTQTTTAYPQPVYGPPPVFESTETSETTKTTKTTKTTATVPTRTTTTAIPQPVYGPPVVLGDVDSDGKVTAFDMVMMRQMAIGVDVPINTYEKIASDLNGDGKVGMADLLLLQRYLMGRIDDPRDYYMSETLAELELGEEFGIPSYPMYGPPPDFVIEPVTTDPYDPVTDIKTTYTAVYGPPWSNTTKTTAVEEPYDPVKTVQTEMADVYGPPSWFSEKE